MGNRLDNREEVSDETLNIIVERIMWPDKFMWRDIEHLISVILIQYLYNSFGPAPTFCSSLELPNILRVCLSIGRLWFTTTATGKQIPAAGCIVLTFGHYPGT